MNDTPRSSSRRRLEQSGPARGSRRPIALATCGVAALALLVGYLVGDARVVFAEAPRPLSDQPINILGTVGDDTTFRASFRLATRRPTDVFIYASEVRSWPDPAPPSMPLYKSLAVIPAARLSVDPHAAQLGTSPYTNFQVALSGIHSSGTYFGYLEVFYRPTPSGGRSHPEVKSTAGLPSTFLTVKVVAQAPAHVDVALGDMAATFRSSRCGQAFDCWLAQELLPRSELEPGHEIIVSNPGESAVTIVSARADALGDRSGQRLADADYSWDETLPTVVPPRSSTTLTLALASSRLPADRYRGTVYLETSDQTGLKSIPLDVTVRDGPLGPLGFIVAGLLIGYLAKYMAEGGDKIVSLSNELSAVRADVGAARLPVPDQRYLLDEVAAIDEKIRKRSELEAVKPRLERLRGWLDDFALVAETSETHPDESILAAMTRVRRAIHAENDDELAQAVADLRTAVANRDVSNVVAPAPAGPESGLRALPNATPAPAADAARPTIESRRRVVLGSLAVLLLAAFVGTALIVGLLASGQPVSTNTAIVQGSAVPSGTATISPPPPTGTAQPPRPIPTPPSMATGVGQPRPRPTFVLRAPVVTLATPGPSASLPSVATSTTTQVVTSGLAALLAIGVVLLGLTVALSVILAAARTRARGLIEGWAPRVLGLAKIYLTLVLFLGLTVIGLKTLYIDQSAAVVGGVVDPLVQFLFWGLASGVASRALGNLAPAALAR